MGSVGESGDLSLMTSDRLVTRAQLVELREIS